MNEIITSILRQLENIEEAVEEGDCYDIRAEIHLLGRIIERFFKKSSYEGVLNDADEDNEDLIDKEGRDKDLEKHVKHLVFMIIENMREELKVFGLPGNNDLKIDKSITINNQHTLSQNQTLNISLLKEVLQDSLTGKQYKELTEIVKEEKDTKKASSKIVEKLKSFGSDVASNIVASLITNPHLIIGLF
ncbi:MAG TPA: hypothetical protein VIM89_11270 [Mucilaginibacter sp.]